MVLTSYASPNHFFVSFIKVVLPLPSAPTKANILPPVNGRWPNDILNRRAHIRLKSLPERTNSDLTQPFNLQYFRALEIWYELRIRPNNEPVIRFFRAFSKHSKETLGKAVPNISRTDV